MVVCCSGSKGVLWFAIFEDQTQNLASAEAGDRQQGFLNGFSPFHLFTFSTYHVRPAVSQSQRLWTLHIHTYVAIDMQALCTSTHTTHTRLCKHRAYLLT